MTSDADVLKARAERLAARMDEVALDRTRVAVLVVRLGTERFAIPMTAVDRVLPYHGLIPVPLASARVRGVMAVRGEIHSIYHLERVLDLPSAAGAAGAGDGPSDATQIVILRGEAHAGVTVDAVEAIDFVDPAEAKGVARAFVTPTSSEPLILLDNLTSLVAHAAGENL